MTWFALVAAAAMAFSAKSRSHLNKALLYLRFLVSVQKHAKVCPLLDRPTCPDDVGFRDWSFADRLPCEIHLEPPLNSSLALQTPP